MTVGAIARVASQVRKLQPPFLPKHVSEAEEFVCRLLIMSDLSPLSV